MITQKPMNKNQGVNSNANSHLNSIITKSCKKPLNANVIKRDKEAGNMILSGLKIYFPK